MKDIDFDELDKAVSSVLGKQPQTPSTNETPSTVAPAVDAPTTAEVASTETMAAEPASTATETTVETTAAEAGQDTPASSLTLESEVLSGLGSVTPAEEPTATEPTPGVHSEPVELPSESEEPAPLEAPATPAPEVTSESLEPTASPAATRRGRFMDVVHPSSDMNPDSSPTAGPVVQHKTITPLNPDVVPEEVGAQPEVSETLDSLSSDVASVEATAVAGAPEPTDTMAQTTEDSAEAPMTEEPELLTDLVEDAAPHEQSNEQPSDELAATPFIPGVEVDKRPLGQAAETVPDETETPASEEAPLMPELHTESQLAPVNDVSQRELQADIVTAENTHEAEDVDATVPSGSVMAQTTDAPSMASAEPVTEKPAENPLFDTQTYNQPLSETTAAKKKTAPWVWLVSGLIGCLAVGGAVGGAIFYLGL